MIFPTLGKLGEGMTYRALCQDCLHVQPYACEQDMLDAHQERTNCQKCDGQMCACEDCLRVANEQGAS